MPVDPPAWLGELAAAVETGAFELPRVVLASAARDEAAEWLKRELPAGAVSEGTRDALARDILALIDLQTSLTGHVLFMMRLFAEAPTRRCGFHVDTTRARGPTIGLLKVYNGEGTLYVDPSNVASTSAFYRYVQRRERLSSELVTAASQRGTRYAEVLDEVLDLDDRPPFAIEPDEVGVVPAGSTIAFKHLDVRQHWSNHPLDQAWIHGSPSEGAPRLVVNITPAGGSRLAGPR